jgi:hypothetical protein
MCYLGVRSALPPLAGFLAATITVFLLSHPGSLVLWAANFDPFLVFGHLLFPCFPGIHYLDPNLFFFFLFLILFYFIFFLQHPPFFFFLFLLFLFLFHFHANLTLFFSPSIMIMRRQLFLLLLLLFFFFSLTPALSFFFFFNVLTQLPQHAFTNMIDFYLFIF